MWNFQLVLLALEESWSSSTPTARWMQSLGLFRQNNPPGVLEEQAKESGSRHHPALGGLGASSSILRVAVWGVSSHSVGLGLGPPSPCAHCVAWCLCGRALPGSSTLPPAPSQDEPGARLWSCPQAVVPVSYATLPCHSGSTASTTSCHQAQASDVPLGSHLPGGFYPRAQRGWHQGFATPFLGRARGQEGHICAGPLGSASSPVMPISFAVIMLLHFIFLFPYLYCYLLL